MPTDTESHKNKTQIKHKIISAQNTGHKYPKRRKYKRAHVKKILDERNSGMPLPTEKFDTKKLNTFGISLFIQRY